LHWEQKVFVKERSAGPFFSETQSCTAQDLGVGQINALPYLPVENLLNSISLI
jgi:hypothetical protein